MSVKETPSKDRLPQPLPPRHQLRGYTKPLRVAVLLCAGIASLRVLYHRFLTFGHGDRPPLGSGRLGAVATESSICSQIGIDILKRGGNAADAIIASTLCVGVVGMYHSGIGGGGFAVIRSPSGSYETIDFRPAAPASAYEEMFNNDTSRSISGGLSIGVPGELRGLEHIHRKYGSFPWRELVEPAIRVARYGFVVGEDLDRCIQATASMYPDDNFLLTDPSWTPDFSPNGALVKLGDKMFRKRFANTLEEIASQGPGAFYTGQIAESITRTINDKGGNVSLRDLGEFSVRRLTTANATYHRHRLFGTTAPSSGAITISALKILEGYEDIFALGTASLSTHRLVEAMKFAYGQRFRLGDPSFVEGLDQYQRDIVSDEIARQNRAKISDNHTQDTDVYNPDGYGPSPSSGTSHVVATDWTGLSISMTTTVNLWFGSRVMTPDTGIIFNDAMSDFSIPGQPNGFGYAPSPANFIRPGKRPMSSTTPLFVEDLHGNLQLIIGAAGGSRITSTTIQNIVHVLHQNMSMAEALAQPRLHDQLIPAKTEAESDYDSAVLEFLRGRGHNVTLMASTLSAAQGVIRQPNGTFDAAGEPRQKNSAGYSI